MFHKSLDNYRHLIFSIRRDPLSLLWLCGIFTFTGLLQLDALGDGFAIADLLEAVWRTI